MLLLLLLPTGTFKRKSFQINMVHGEGIEPPMILQCFESIRGRNVEIYGTFNSAKTFAAISYAIAAAAHPSLSSSVTAGEEHQTSRQAWRVTRNASDTPERISSGVISFAIRCHCRGMRIDSREKYRCLLRNARHPSI
jgi:hypothetical protein